MASKLRGTDLIHGDNIAGSIPNEVAPSISVSTTFRQPKPSGVDTVSAVDLRNPSRHVYSRYTQSISTRAEHILGRINDGYALTYSSGLAAAYAALVFFKPKRIAISGGYHGCHATIEVYKKARGADIPIIDIEDDFQGGDLCWLETPLNPTGESRDIGHYAEKESRAVHKVGGKLLVDATFGPPPLQYPFKFGADCVFHSATKYFGGHSDLLGGVLIVKSLESWNSLISDRIFLGSVMGSLEAWLLLRSLRTLHLRVPRQSETATSLAQWLNAVAKTPAGQNIEGVPGGIIEKVWHSSLQPVDSRGFDPRTQMEGGWNATFAMLLKDPEHARHLPHLLKYFVPATSLGGVESLVEQRLQSDPGADPRLIRLSIGVEEFEDLKNDLKAALILLAQVCAFSFCRHTPVTRIF
ncbi:cystathionine gamma-synthase [Pluteus cervinus]|uniref:Cystathionine gamma-synthase n=1 Tax=Pluteus cervinus TaxID=181527 RepID=A0ACD3BEC2_9AGAR|nr:cystathionine gamma-synthase [Pluteus cervinus]